MLSPCCGCPLYVAYGEFLCGNCWEHVVLSKRLDIITWLFKPETGPRPHGEAVFVRYGKTLQLLTSDKIRGRPDSWSWSGA
jgi:hypothetical protein